MKNLMNLGKALNKNEQKAINGGKMVPVEVICFGDIRDPETGQCPVNLYWSEGQCCGNM